MKKYIFFLIAFMTVFFLGMKTVHAKEYQFYESTYLGGIYMSKYEYATNTVYYQTARFFQERGTGNLVYCIEPFVFFQDGSIYQEVDAPRNLSPEQLDRIRKIIYFGYQYNGHWDSSWYAVVQMMIWRTASPNEGDYYFTDTLNGTRSSVYDDQIAEIESLIYNLEHEIPINNQTITLVKGTEKEIYVGDILNQYTTENDEIQIEDGKIIIKDLEEGEYNIHLERPLDVYYRKPHIIYGAPNSQYLIARGDLEPNEANFKINVISNHIDIKKEDEDNNSFTPQGDASLIGSVYELYNEENELIRTIEIKEEKETIKDIPFGTYYLKEKTPGKGYTLNNTTYEITLSEESPNDEITVTNKVIEKKITIHKQYGIDDSLNPEENISFEIFNQKDELIETIQTNEEGIAEITLPYGKYKFIQINSTEGYQKIEPLIVDIQNSEDETIELKDYKIPVPDTHTNIFSYLLFILKNWLCLC